MNEDSMIADGARLDETSPISADTPPAPRPRRGWVWVGLIPFFGFLSLFLFLPTVGAIRKAFIGNDGNFTTESFTAAITDERSAFFNSIRISLLTAAFGVVFGTAVAYAAATARRPKWLRSAVSAFSGVAANMGGIILAFLFLTLLGRQGLATKILTDNGWDPYDSGFSINGFSGIMMVYMYFQIPLMVLVTLPAIDGLKASWREASANLGGTTFTYWRRVGLPVLAPSLMGGFLLLFANAYSAFATAYALNTQSNLVPIKISFYLQGDVTGRSPLPYALATWMIIFMGISMGGYILLRRRAERWQR